MKYTGIAVWPNSETSVYIYKDEFKKLSLAEYLPRLVNACIIEDNSIRALWNQNKKAAWGGDRKYPPPHTVVKVNSNAVGTYNKGMVEKEFST